jgi:hypothetical protein
MPSPPLSLQTRFNGEITSVQVVPFETCTASGFPRESHCASPGRLPEYVGSTCLTRWPPARAPASCAGTRSARRVSFSDVCRFVPDEWLWVLVVMLDEFHMGISAISIENLVPSLLGAISHRARSSPRNLSDNSGLVKSLTP